MLNKSRLEKNLESIKELIKKLFPNAEVEPKHELIKLTYGYRCFLVDSRGFKNGFICQVDPKESVFHFFVRSDEEGDEQEEYSFDMEEVKQVSITKNTSDFINAFEDVTSYFKNKQIVTFITKNGAVEIAFYEDTDLLEFFQNVIQLCSNMNNAELYEQRIWNFFDKDMSGSLDKEEFQLFCMLINSSGNSESLFKHLDKDKSGAINFNEFYDFFKSFNSGNEFKDIFKKFSTDKKTLSFMDLKNFFTTYQGENFSDKTIANVIVELRKSPDVRKIDEYESLAEEVEKFFKGDDKKVFKKGDPLLSKLYIELHEFKKLIISKFSNVLNEEKIEANLEAHRPINDYFINSSHNTYLCGHQLYGESSEEMYADAMNLGYRLVELDCYDGKDTDINVTHGYTLVDKVKLVNVLTILQQNAFINSKYPVILSVENHLGKKHQQQMADDIKRIFGKNLYILDQNKLPEDLPPLKAMKNCFIIKAGGERPKGPDRSKVKPRSKRIYIKLKEEPEIKKLNTLEIGYGNTGNNPLEATKQNLKATRKAKTKTINEPKGRKKSEDEIRAEIEKMLEENFEFTPSLLAIRGFIGTKFDYNKLETNNYQPYEFVTLKSPKFNGFMKDFAQRAAISKFSTTTLMKAYPQRFDSINYDPIKVWIVGGQVAALNLQSVDEDYTMINKVFFMQNKGAGYVMKPKKLLPESLAPEKYLSPKGTITIRVYNLIDATSLILEAKKQLKTKPKISIVFKFYGSLEDDKNNPEQSLHVTGNLYSPSIDNKVIKFNVYEAELGCIVVRLEYEGSVIARSAIPLCMLKPGLRRISLFDLEQDEAYDSSVIADIQLNGLKINY